MKVCAKILKALYLAIVFLLTLFASCEDTFRGDPYHGNVPDDLKNLNENNLKRIFLADTMSYDTFRIALISDTHYGYDEFQEAINIINQRDYRLVIHLGDLTQAGLFDEYLTAAQICQQIQAPVLVIPGNHDYLASGQYYFREFFGEANIDLQVERFHLVLWDNCYWERTEGTPNTTWLKASLDSDTSQTLVFCHFPPWDVQMADSYGNLYSSQMLQHSVLASLHGHLHDPMAGYPYSDGIQYIVTGSTLNRYYTEIILTPYKCSSRIIEF